MAIVIGHHWQENMKMLKLYFILPNDGRDLWASLLVVVACGGLGGRSFKIKGNKQKKRTGLDLFFLILLKIFLRWQLRRFKKILRRF